MAQVLLIDDHKIMLEGLAMLLNNEPDITVVGAGCVSEDAVELVGDLKPDVVVMDVMMEGMDGIETTRILKRRWPDIRVIGLSMNKSDETAQKMRDAGAEAYLTKGGPSQDLILAIRGQSIMNTP